MMETQNSRGGVEVRTLKNRPLRALRSPPLSVSTPEARFLAFVALWLFVGLVSAYDGYLTIRYQHTLHEFERNPLGRWIMDLDAGLITTNDYGYVVHNRQLANFLGLKFTGTIVSLGVMLVVHRYHASMGLLVTGVVAGLQGGLAVYLLCF